MDVFVARQPIFDRRRRVHGYELLFRSGANSTQFDGTDASAATTQVVANSIFAIGLDTILCGKKAFLNLGHGLLVDGWRSILPKEIAVIEVLESVEPDAEVLAACRTLREEGYSIALDDFVPDPRWEALTHFANLIKVDMRRTSRAEQERLLRTYKSRGIAMLAEKVETYEEFQWARTLGYDYFQGYFFARPIVLRGTQIPSSTLTCLRLLQESQRPSLDFGRLEALISDDVSLSYKLLRYVNSALYQRSGHIRSIREAVIRIGEYGMRRWLLLAALPQMAAHKPSELATLSIVRAHFCERLARCARIPEHNEAFLMGLFSLLDALIDRPLDEALSHVKLAPALTNALLGVSTEADPFSSLFQLVRCYEMADWGAVHRFAAQLQLPVSEVSEAYLDATRRADDMLSEVVN